MPGTVLGTGDKTVSKANKNSHPPRTAILAESHMINATVKLRVCLTEMCAMENSKGKWREESALAGAGEGGWQESRVVRFGRKNLGGV